MFNGSMKTPMLSIEDGVLFNGGLEMSQGMQDGTAPPGRRDFACGSETCELIGKLPKIIYQ